MLLLGRAIDSLHFSVSVISCTRVVDAIVLFFPLLVVLPYTLLFALRFFFLWSKSVYDFLLFLWYRLLALMSVLV